MIGRTINRLSKKASIQTNIYTRQKVFLYNKIISPYIVIKDVDVVPTEEYFLSKDNSMVQWNSIVSFYKF